MTDALPPHPGPFLRKTVLRPRHLTVVAAAKLLGVGRPALSNFLNGHVATSPEMAKRIEVAFDIPAQRLLEMQTAFDASVAAASATPTTALPYVASLRAIKATEFEEWADRSLSARSRLAVLLRTLVHSTITNSTRVDFPGNDDAQRPGWDGYIETDKSTPWVPRGTSGWEFGTDLEVKGKADSDFEGRVTSTPSAERKGLAFVFVTPRHWPGKAKWVAAKQALRLWKDVRAYDSSNLEQWMEQSVSAQAWFSNETGRPTTGVRALDQCWVDWANVADPPLVGSLFDSAVAVAARAIGARLQQPPGDPIIITADSAEEGFAFLAQLFSASADPALAAVRDRVLVFTESGVVPRLAQSTGGFIAVTASRAVERELGPFAHTLHSILVYPRNATSVDPLVVLEPLGFQAFESSLEAMSLPRDQIARYADESGRSLTVLRRRMATLPAVRLPAWAAHDETARHLIAFMFAGAWSAENPADQVALARLANVTSYEALEIECQRLLTIDDAPLWSVGTARGVVSKMDMLYAVARVVTAADLRRFFEFAKLVLSEDDPRLDLPEGDRWAAALFDKSRALSGSLRTGTAETLILLSVYGNPLFQNRLGVDCEAEAARIVTDILTPLSGRALEANDRDLTSYAEAAPDALLHLLDEDLTRVQPEVFRLMRPVGSGFFSTCPRTGLLWALESLAWSPRTLPRTVLILARLAEIEIHDNWINTPSRSLAMIFDARMPQTAADHRQRIDALQRIASRYPMVAWRLCVAPFKNDLWTGHYNQKPRWRNDAFGFGEPLKAWEPIRAFWRAISDMVLHWPGDYTREMIGDVVECLHGFSEEQRATAWALIRSWNATLASDEDRARVRDQIRQTVLSRRGRRAADADTTASLVATAIAVSDELAPRDIVNQHAWLFREQWMALSSNEMDDGDRDYEADERHLTDRRVAALRDVLAARGADGVVTLATRGKTAAMIGWLLATKIFARDELLAFILSVVDGRTDEQAATADALVYGALRALQDDTPRWLLDQAHARVTPSRLDALVLLAPFRRAVWEFVDGLEPARQTAYWKTVSPDWMREAPEERRDAMERLLRANRPRAAFACAKWCVKDVDPELLVRVLSAVRAGGDEKPEHFLLDPHDLDDAFDHIHRNAATPMEQKALLEFAFMDTLVTVRGARGAYGIPNLEQYIEARPDLFVQCVVWAFKRTGAGEDPPELVPAPPTQQNFASRGYALLKALDRVPGRDHVGELQPALLLTWVRAVRTGCEEVGRLEVGDLCLGELLSSAPPSPDGVWPGEAVREVLEELHSPAMMRGMAIGRYNSRGVVSRNEGGDQERRLADQARSWADALRSSHPFVASELLDRMAAGYQREAEREDTDARMRRRLR